MIRFLSQGAQNVRDSHNFVLLLKTEEVLLFCLFFSLLYVLLFLIMLEIIFVLDFVVVVVASRAKRNSTMSIFTQRSNGYKSGIIFLWIGCLLFIIGFSSPNWTRTNLHYSGHSRSPARHPSGAMYRRGPLHIRGHNGLWVTCSEANGQTQCASVHSKTPGNWAD